MEATLVIINGSIKSCDLQGVVTVSEAMAVKDDKIIFVGTNEEVQKYITDTTKVIDQKGNTVLPGLCDAHLHSSSTREILEEFTLYSTLRPDITREETIEIVQNTICQFKEKKDISTGIRITGWNPVVFLESEEGLPSAKDLDKVCDEVPVVLRSVCQHYLWLNSKALEKAKVDKNTITPENGIIYRDEEGNPTGIFQELPAVNMIKEILPEADHTIAEYEESIMKFQEMFALPMGITMVCDAMASRNAVKAYQNLARDGRLKIRVSGVYAADNGKPKSQFDEFIERKGKDDVDDMYHIPTVKFFVDGVEFMFYMCEPFEKEALLQAGYGEDYRGFPQWDLEGNKKIFTKLDAAGFQIHIHAMGDGAIKESLEALEYARKQNPDKDNRHAIAHVMNIKPEDVKKMAELNVIGSVQLLWGAYTQEDDKNKFLMGEKRIEECYEFGVLANGGVRLAAGTDFPIDPFLNPYLGMQVGVTRHVPISHPAYEKYKDVIRGGVKNCLTRDQVLAAYTINGAYEMFYDDITGELVAGKSADFVLLDCNMDQMEIDEFENIRPTSVYFKGKEAYKKTVEINRKEEW